MIEYNRRIRSGVFLGSPDGLPSRSARSHGFGERLRTGLMLSPKRVAGFFIRFLLVFVVLMAPWPRVDVAYATVYQTVANVLFARFFSDGLVRFDPSPTPARDRQLEVTLENRRTGVAVIFPFNSRTQGYKPTAFVLALILATPIRWSRRWRALLWGFLCVNGYVILKATLFLFAGFSGDAELAPFTLGVIGTKILVYLHWVVIASFAGWLILPLPIWALVSFRRKDWEVLLHGKATSPAAD